MTAPNMVDKRGRTFALAAYVIGAGFVLIVFESLLAVRYPDVAPVLEKLTSHFAIIASVGLTAIGLRATASEWKKTPDAPSA